MRCGALGWILGMLTLVAGALPSPASAADAGARPPPAELPPGLAEQLARREYEATTNPRGLQAPNRAHALRTYFEPGGIRVHDRSAPGSPELLALRLAGFGRGETLASVAPGEVTHEGARVEIRRPGIVEWYVNSDAGLEQGFTLSERPAGEGTLVFELALSGARASAQGDGLIFATAAGRRLRYGALHVVDAAGRALPARFELPTLQRVRIAVDDAVAHYPIVVDPLLTETADAQVTSDQNNAHLGHSVASAGDVNGDGYADVVVGAPYYDVGQTDEGAAFIFLGSPNGIASGNAATAAARLESDDAGAHMGYSVAGAGDVNGDGYADAACDVEDLVLIDRALRGASATLSGCPAWAGP